MRLLGGLCAAALIALGLTACEKTDITSRVGIEPGVTLTNSGSVATTRAGQTIERLNISGTITVRHDDTRIRNVKVTGSSSTAVIKIDRDVRRTHISNCVVNVTSGGANGGIGYLGYDTTVQWCDISGYADGIKAESGGTYQFNHIHMSKPAGAAKHLDGIQGSGDTNYTIRWNVIDAAIERGGNAAIFVQAWNGAKNSPIRDIVVEGNFVRGGNYTVYLEGGKNLDGSNPASWFQGGTLRDNTFEGGFRYGHARCANPSKVQVSGNVLADGTPFKPC